MTVRRLSLLGVAAAALAVGSCDSGPKAGEIVAELVTTKTDLGAASFRVSAVDPYTIDAVAAACTGCTAYTVRVTDQEMRGIVTGALSAGPLLRVTVSDRGVVDPYTAELLEFAAIDYATLPITGSGLRFE